MPAAATQTLYHWNDPETKLQFLELVMRGRSWEANILLPADKRSPTAIADLKHRLEGHGYVVQERRDLFQAPILHVAHIGSDSGFIENLHQLGIVKGISKSVDNMGSALSHSLSRAYDYAKYVGTDSARMIGAVYLVGDAAVTVSPFLNRQTAHMEHTGNGLSNMLREMKNPYNQLQLGQGLSTVLQSFIFMHYAEDGKGVLLSDMQRHIDASQSEKKSPLDAALWTDKDQHGVISQVDHFLRRNAITTGALTLIMGQLGYMVAGYGHMTKWTKAMDAFEHGSLNADTLKFLDRFNPKPGLDIAQKIKLNADAGRYEMGRGLLSIGTWSAFIYNAKEHPDKPSWLQNPLRRAHDEFEENPQRTAAVLSVLSSSMGMMAGGNKGNMVQKYGEATYFLADALMFFTRKKDYGKENASLDANMAEAAVTLIERAPFAFAPQELDNFIDQLAAYMISHDSYKDAHDTRTDTQRQSALHQMIYTGVTQRATPYTQLCDAAGALIARMPEAVRGDYTKHLCTILCHSENVFAQPEAMAEAIASRLSAMHYQPSAAPDMSVLLPALVELAYRVPGMNVTDTVIALFEATTQYVGAQPVNREQLSSQMQAAALQALRHAPAPTRHI